MTPLRLDGRLLWPDGDVEVTPDKLVDYIYKFATAKQSLSKLKVTELTPDVVSYNAVADEPISTKKSVDPSLFPPSWDLPDKYKYLDLDEYLVGLVSRIEQDSLYEKRVERLSLEIWLFKELQLDDVLRALIYVIDSMKENNVVWGVGRGSSCSSYLFFLLGLHCVDPVKYDVEITDFIRLQEDRDAKNR
jgi:DNA polymerase III alpha subunit